MENVAEVRFFSFISRMQISTLINYSTNMCRTNYERTVY